MPKSDLFVDWDLVEKEMKKRGLDLTGLKKAVAADEVNANIARACARSIDNAKAGKPVIKATVRAIARALEIEPSERLLVGYQPPTEPLPPEQVRTTREIVLNSLSPDMLDALEDLLPFLDKLRDAIKARDDMHGKEVKDGSLRITLELSARDAAALDAIFAAGKLKDIGVAEVSETAADGDAAKPVAADIQSALSHAAPPSAITVEFVLWIRSDDFDQSVQLPPFLDRLGELLGDERIGGVEVGRRVKNYGPHLYVDHATISVAISEKGLNTLRIAEQERRLEQLNVIYFDVSEGQSRPQQLLSPTRNADNRDVRNLDERMALPNNEEVHVADEQSEANPPPAKPSIKSRPSDN